MVKTSVKFQKSRSKTVGGVAHTTYILYSGKDRRADRQTDGMTESQKLCPFAFLRKGGGDNNRTAIGHYIVILYWYSSRIVYRYLHVTSIVPFNCFIDGTRNQNDLCHDMYCRLSRSIWQRCTMPGIFVDIYLLKASTLSY